MAMPPSPQKEFSEGKGPALCAQKHKQGFHSTLCTSRNVCQLYLEENISLFLNLQIALLMKWRAKIYFPLYLYFSKVNLNFFFNYNQLLMNMMCRIYHSRELHGNRFKVGKITLFPYQNMTEYSITPPHYLRDEFSSFLSVFLTL